ncbi:hypothetical protein JCM5296_002511 [Sporobolomyces johnsonii]
MDMIAHKHGQAIAKLERAVQLDSSNACATLANLLARGYRADPACVSPTNPPSQLPSPALGIPASASASALSSSSIHLPRPPMPDRSSSLHQALYQPSSQRSPDALRATELFIKGAEIELGKPVEDERVGQGRYGRSYEDSEEYEGAEGKHWSLERALDLIVGISDSHRFGVLRPPSPVEPTTSSKHPVEASEELNDALWARSSVVASSVLSHPSIAPLVTSVTFSSSNTPGTSYTQRTMSPSSSRSRRTSSVSRSYTHPSSMLPDVSPAAGQGIHLTPTKKLQLTVAIHALYILALQAWSTPSSPPPSSSTSPSSQVANGIRISLASPVSPPLPFLALSSHSVLPTSPQSGKALAESLFQLITLLTPPNGQIGIKEGDELISRAQRRLDAIRNADRGEEEPWRQAKKGRRSIGATMPTEAGPLESSADSVTGANEHAAEHSSGIPIRPAIHAVASSSHSRPHSSSYSNSSVLTVRPGGSSLGRTPRATGVAKFHFAPEEEVEEVEEPESPGMEQQRQLALSKEENGSQNYPSPPNTPPLPSASTSQALPFTTALASLSPPRPAPTASPSATRTSALSPPPASPLQSRFSLPPSRLPGRPHRAASVSSAHTGAFSILSQFKHDPTRSILRRVESTTSVSTVPPDFGATRLRPGDKGKGKAIDPEPLSASWGMGVLARQGGGGARLADVEHKAGKSWLSRFWAVSNLAPPLRERSSSSTRLLARVRPGAGRNQSAVDELRGCLARHDEASQADFYVMDWGDADEEEEHIEGEGSSSPSPSLSGEEADGSSPALSGFSALPDSEQEDVPERETAHAEDVSSASTAKVHRVASVSSFRTTKSKRSFVLSDPTSTLSDSFSSPQHPQHKSHRRHRRHASSGSSSGLLSPLSAHTALPPKPVPIDPLLLELERSSRVGVRTTCAACSKKGLNFPACTGCQKTYCSRACRVGMAHECARKRHEVVAVSQAEVQVGVPAQERVV